MATVIKMTGRGARGPMGPASGPLGSGSVTAETISDNSGEQEAIREKIGVTGLLDTVFANEDEIRADIDRLGVEVGAAQAGLVVVPDVAARDAFFADAENQGRLVYVNNNNGSGADPANGVYEYNDGAPRIAASYYSGVATVVQPLVDQATAAAATAAFIAAQKLDQQQDLTNAENYTVVRADNGAGYSGTVTSVTSGVITQTASAQNARLGVIPTGLTKVGGFDRYTLQHQTVSKGATTTAPLGIAFGAQGSRQHVLWNDTGGVAVRDDNNDVIGSPLGGTDLTRAYGPARDEVTGPDDIAVMMLDHLGDAAGTVQVRGYVNGSPVFNYTATGIPTGEVWISGSSPISTRKIWPVAAGGYNDTTAEKIADALAGNTGEAYLSVRSFTALPDTTNGGVPPNGGFASTGADEIGLTGEYAGCWIVGNDGRQSMADDAVNYCSIIILSPDRRRIVAEFPCNTTDFPGIKSIQGVCWDESDDTIWFVDMNNQMIRHISMAGVKLTDEFAPGYIPNGLARYPSLDGLWVTKSKEKEIRLFSAATGLEIPGHLITTNAAATDQIGYRESDDLLYLGFGNNGVDASIQFLKASTGLTYAILPAPMSQANEGVKISNLTGRLVIFNDGSLHTEAKPPLALSVEYDWSLGL